jgi:4-aminobutyrate aminotransferase/(S)-3-amino-2-methylpropionate transaminase
VGTIDLKTEIPGPKSRAVIERARSVTAEALTIHAPVVIDRGEGAAITDLDGNTLLDFSGGLGWSRPSTGPRTGFRTPTSR